MAKLSLYYPVTPFFINQGFGVNPTLYAQFGINGHNGLDLAAKHGEPVYAAHDGQAWYEIDDDQGHGVIVVSNEKFDYKDTQAYFKTIYWHLCDSSKEPQYRSPIENYTNIYKPGFQVLAGDLIGYADNTGFSTGDHCHFGLKPQTQDIIGEYANIEQSNGFLGAIDPTPYLNGLSASDIHPQFSPFNVNLSFGVSSPEVRRLQMALQKLGYFTYPEITDFYGSNTKAAVLLFQYHNNVVTFGWESWFGSFFGPKSRAALNKLLASS